MIYDGEWNKSCQSYDGVIVMNDLNSRVSQVCGTNTMFRILSVESYNCSVDLQQNTVSEYDHEALRSYNVMVVVGSKKDVRSIC